MRNSRTENLNPIYIKAIKLLTIVLGLGLGLLTSCQQKKDDPEVLKKILMNYFDGIKTQDLDKLNSLITSDFVLFEDGKIWTNDSLVTIKEKFNSFKGEWTLRNMKVNIDNSSSDITYYDHGEFVFNDTIKIILDWLESATFKKLTANEKWIFYIPQLGGRLPRTTAAICNGWVTCKLKVVSSLLRLVTVDKCVFKSQQLQIAKL